MSGLDSAPVAEQAGLATDPSLVARVAALTDFYRQVERERMQGMALVNPALAVQALGFRWPDPDAAPTVVAQVAEGILITPWCMNLVRLPASAEPAAGRVARRSCHDFGVERFDFLGADGPGVGYHEMCALFSPMNGFCSQEQAVETARAVLALTHPPGTRARQAPSQPARRAFLLGRGSGAGGGG